MSQEFIILDPSHSKVGLLEDYDSIQWREDYNGAGYMEIHAAPSDLNRSLLAIGNSVKLGESVGDIQAVQFRTNEIAAYGKMALDRLSARVILKTEVIGSVESSLRGVFTRNERGSGLALGASAGLSEAVDSQITGGTVLEGFTAILGKVGLGMRVDSDFTLRFYKGIDRRRGQPGYVGFLSEDTDTLTNIILTGDIARYFNVAVVAGAGDGAARVWTNSWLASVEPTGTARRELFVDARDLAKTYTIEGDPTIYTYTDEVYLEKLKERGRQKLAEALFDSRFTADVIDGNMTYGTDYSLGDILPIRIAKYGVSYSCRVVSATHIHEKETKVAIKVEKII
ncbi:conserved hypothetical protein [Gammaproteobacteria bacterium]